MTTRIKTAEEVERALTRILQYTHTERPSRARLAGELAQLRDRLARETFRPGQWVVLGEDIPGLQHHGFRAGDRVKVVSRTMTHNGDTYELESKSGEMAEISGDYFTLTPAH